MRSIKILKNISTFLFGINVFVCIGCFIFDIVISLPTNKASRLYILIYKSAYERLILDMKPQTSVCNKSYSHLLPFVRLAYIFSVCLINVYILLSFPINFTTTLHLITIFKDLDNAIQEILIVLQVNTETLQVALVLFVYLLVSQLILTKDMFSIKRKSPEVMFLSNFKYFE